jgi:hypothetical protein
MDRHTYWLEMIFYDLLDTPPRFMLDCIRCPFFFRRRIDMSQMNTLTAEVVLSAPAAC